MKFNCGNFLCVEFELSIAETLCCCLAKRNCILNHLNTPPTLHTAAAPAVRAAFKTELTRMTFSFPANKKTMLIWLCELYIPFE